VVQDACLSAFRGIAGFRSRLMATIAKDKNDAVA
jgi:hypothetical protein